MTEKQGSVILFMTYNLNKISKSFVLQQDQQDCGVACLLSIIKYYNGNSTVENLRNLSGTNINGTTLLGLYQAANKLGFVAEGCEADMTALIEHKQPIILHVIVDSSIQHYVVYFGSCQKDDAIKLIIGDPAKGIVYLSPEEVKDIWKSRACLILTPGENFKTIETLAKAKKEWIIHLIKEDYNLLGVAAAIGLAIASLGMAMAIFSQKLIDGILPNKEYFKLNFGITLLLFLLIIKEGFSYLRQLFLFQQSQRFNNRIIDFFYSHLLKLPKSFFDTRKIGDLTARLNDTSRIQKVITQIAGNVAIDALIVLVSLIFLFVYSWKTGLISIVILPIFFWVIYHQRKKIESGQRNIMQSYAASESNYISTLQGIATIKNHNKQPLFTLINNSLYQKYQNTVFLFGKIQIRLTFLANSFGILYLITVLYFTSYQVLKEHIKVGELMAILGMCGSLLPSIANLAMIAIPINEAKIAFDRMFEFTGIDPEENETHSIITQVQSLSIQDLSFRFPGRSQILKNISLDIKRNEIIAIIGENGSGKSTLSQIIQKNYIRESGNIIINNQTDLNAIAIFEWRKYIGVTPQNIHLFNGTVLENIAFEDATQNPQNVINFLKMYEFLPHIEKLPQSFMTLVGEEGINLSGGQQQIIALARALYFNPQLLIIDEGTSAMDRDTEQFVINLLFKIKKEIPTIFISHRIHILKSFCDRIYILENGKIIAHGSHTHLLTTPNLYSNFWNTLK